MYDGDDIDQMMEEDIDAKAEMLYQEGVKKERIRRLETDLFLKRKRRVRPRSEKYDPRDVAIAGGDPSL